MPLPPPRSPAESFATQVARLGEAAAGAAGKDWLSRLLITLITAFLRDIIGYLEQIAAHIAATGTCDPGSAAPDNRPASRPAETTATPLPSLPHTPGRIAPPARRWPPIPPAATPEPSPPELPPPEPPRPAPELPPWQVEPPDRSRWLAGPIRGSPRKAGAGHVAHARPFCCYIESKSAA